MHTSRQNIAPGTRKQHRAIQAVVSTLVFIAIILPLGFILDRPTAVSAERDEGVLASRNQWISAAFHTLLPLFVLTNFGVWGFALIPLMVLVVARRLSASRAGIPYVLGHLYANVTDQLHAGAKVRNVILYGTAVTLLLQMATLFGAPTSFLATVAATVVWGGWLFLAVQAAKLNVAAAAEEYAVREKYIAVLSKAFGTPVGDWENSVLSDEGLRLTVTPPPVAARLHYAQADSILAQAAPEWEMNHEESNHEVLVLNAASEETIQRRAEEAQSGGLIGGKITGAPTPSAAPVSADFSISADELV